MTVGGDRPRVLRKTQWRRPSPACQTGSAVMSITALPVRQLLGHDTEGASHAVELGIISADKCSPALDGYRSLGGIAHPWGLPHRDAAKQCAHHRSRHNYEPGIETSAVS